MTPKVKVCLGQGEPPITLQQVVDQDLNTDNKTIVGAINEILEKGGTFDPTDPSSYATVEQLNKKVDKVEGSRLMTNDEGTKLESIEDRAQENVVESISVNGAPLVIDEKTVNISIAGEDLGVVKSSNGENKVSVNSDGEMIVNNLNVNKLVQTPGEELVLYGGTSK